MGDLIFVIYFSTLIRNCQVSLNFPWRPIYFALFVCILVSWEMGGGEVGVILLKMHNFLPACNCFNIIMLLDDYRIWRPVTILHLFLWERIYSARKGFALCCASMQMCVIGLLFSVFVFSVWPCLLLMHDSDAQFYKVYWTLVKHWFTCCIGVVLFYRKVKGVVYGFLNIIIHFVSVASEKESMPAFLCSINRL